MKKKYKIIPRKKLYPYWKEFCVIHDEFHGKVGQLESKMSKELDIPDMVIFKADWGGDYCGIGDAGRTVKLVQFDPE
ncbi:MAG: hypothetical protein KKC77_19785 [Proteobacteria bacterium]|nr:hypothetical protein [Pseudomonadota bacterium]